MKRYKTELTVFNKDEEVDKIVRWLHETFPT